MISPKSFTEDGWKHLNGSSVVWFTHRFLALFTSVTDANVEDAPSERGANLVTKTSMSSNDGGDPKQR